jgi:hypothetical protein
MLAVFIKKKGVRQMEVDDKYIRYLVIQMLLADIGAGIYILLLRYALNDSAAADKLSLLAITIGSGIFGLIAIQKILHVICHHIPIAQSIGLIFVCVAGICIGWAIYPTVMQYQPILNTIYTDIISINSGNLIIAAIFTAVVDAIVIIAHLVTKAKNNSPN